MWNTGFSGLRTGSTPAWPVEYPDLPDPQAMFDIGYFKRNQGPFFKFAKVCTVTLFRRWPSAHHRLLGQQRFLFSNMFADPKHFMF